MPVSLMARAAIITLDLKAVPRYFFAVAERSQWRNITPDLGVSEFRHPQVTSSEVQKAPPGRFLTLSVTIALSIERVLQAEGGSPVNGLAKRAHTLILVVAVVRQA